MPKRKGETDQEWMERLQRFRADELMHRTRAAVCYVNTGRGEASRLNGFLALFHPDIEPHSPKWMALMSDARQRDSER